MINFLFTRCVNLCIPTFLLHLLTYGLEKKIKQKKNNWKKN